MNPGIFHLALRDLHSMAGAVFSVHAGWSLPAHYGDAASEYGALRSNAAVFDRSHLSRLIVSGTDALDVLSTAFAGDVGELEEGRAMRAVSLRDGLIDDMVLIARTGGISYVVVGEPGRRFQTRDRLEAARRADYDVRIDDRTESTCWIALAGPRTGELASEMFSEALNARVRFMHTSAFELHGFRTLAVRTSDTGEDGFELMLAPAVAHPLLSTMREQGVALAGQEAHHIARVEACVPAFEPDLAPGLTPAEAGIERLLGLPETSRQRLLAPFLLDGDEPLETGEAVVAAGTKVGEVRSCVYSPGLRATIGLAILDAAHAVPGTELLVAGRRGAVAAKPLLRRRDQP